MGRVFHSDRDTYDESLNDEKELGWDHESENEAQLEAKIKTLVQAAANAGLFLQGLQRLGSIPRSKSDSVRIRLNARPPSKVEPQKVYLTPGASPVYPKPQKYPPEKKNLFRRYCSELHRVGFIKKAVRSDWVTPALIVLKKLPAMFQFTTNYRAINAVTVRKNGQCHILTLS